MYQQVRIHLEEYARVERVSNRSTRHSKKSTYGRVSLDPIKMPRLHLQMPLRITTTIGYTLPSDT